MIGQRTKRRPLAKRPTDDSVSEVLGTVILTAVTVILVGGFGVTLINTVNTADAPTTASFSIDAAINRTDPATGGQYVIARLLDGSSFPLSDASLLLLRNGTSITGNLSLMDGADAVWSQGERVYIAATGDAFTETDRITLMISDIATNKPIGRTSVTLVASGVPVAFVNNEITFDAFSLSPSPLTADGSTVGTLVVNVTATYGLDVISRIVVDLRPIGGMNDTLMYDDGRGGDAIAGDSSYAVQFLVSNYTFAQTPGTSTPQFNVTVTDITGRTWTSSALTVTLNAPPLAKVGAGATYTNIISSAAVNASSSTYLRFANMVVRDATQIESDQLQLRVADQNDPTKTWTALVNFADCGGTTPGISSVVMSIDGVTGVGGAQNATWTAPSGCMSINTATAKLDIAYLNHSVDGTGAVAAPWTFTGDPTTFAYGRAGISNLNQANIAFIGDGVSNVPSRVGIGQADIQWGVVTSQTSPGQVVGLTVTRGNGYLDLSWNAPSTGNSPITAYKIYSGTASGSLTLLATTETNTTFRVNGLTNGQTYYFTVSAVNAIGEGTQSAESSGVPATLPTAPQDLVLTPGDGHVNLSWTAPASDGGNAITNYNIYVNTANGTGSLLATIGTNTSYRALGLTNGNTYYFQVAAVNGVGTSPRTSIKDATPAGPSGAPDNFAVARGNGFLDLSWDAPADSGGGTLTGYKIYWGTTSGDLALLETIGTNTTYRVNGLTNGVTYYFQIVPVTSTGDGTATSEVSGVPATLPSAPQNLTLARGDAFVDISWSVPSSDGGSAITNYNIYLNTANSTGTLLATIGTNTSFRAAGLTNGVTYYLQVAATNGVGTSPRTSIKDATPATTPTAPQSLSATSGEGYVDLSWSAPASNGGAAVTGYKVYRGTTSGSLSLIDTIGTNTTYRSGGLTNGQLYYFAVVAVNPEGDGPRSTEATATPATTPAAPQGLAASAGDRQVSLSWSAPASNGGSAITGYKIYRGTTSGSLALLDTIGTNTSYVAAGLTNGETYYFQVRAVNAVGDGALTTEVSATPTALVSSPGSPQSLTPTAGNEQVSLSWSAPASDGGSPVLNYKIYSGTTSGSLTLLATIGTNTTYVAAGLTNGQTYYFQVSAVNVVGEGSRTSEVSATPATTASAPTGFAAVLGNTNVSLSWNTPVSDGGSAITGYKIYRGTSSGSLTLIETIGTNTSYVSAGLTNGVTYYFQVRAVTSLGDGAPSSEISATPATVPTAPQSFGVTPGNTQVDLSWTAPSSDGGSGITGYKIYRGTSSGSLTLLDTIGTNTSYVSAGLTNGQAYYFQVRAVNAIGDGPLSSEQTATPRTTPSAPQNLAATAGNAQVSLAWTAPSSDGGSAITGYKIYRGTSSGSLTLIDTIGTNTSYVAAGLANGVTYYFAVSAVNAAGESAQSSEQSATPASTPTAPQSLSATPGNTQVSLSWSAPASDGGSAITNYKIYRGTSSGSLTLLATIGTNTSFVSAGLTNGVTYYYAVSAVTSAGEGAQSSEASATPRTTPGAPQSLSATAGNAQVSLSWSAPSSDGGSAITGYKIYRGTTTGSLSLLATIGTNTSFVSAGLTNGQIYYYAVSAVNAAGEGAQSSEASATPRTTPGASQGLSATAGNAQVSLSWSAPSSDGGSAITSYKIYRGTSSGSLSLIATIGTNTSFVSAGLTNGQIYYYAVSAANAAGEGPQSTEASATPRTAPTAPQSLSATAGNTQVSLSWSAPSSNGGSAITSYKIYRGTSSGSLTLLATIGTNTSFVSAGLTNGQIYYYAVSAVNAAGEGTQSSEASATPRTTPGAPQSLSATAGNAQVSLTWAAPASDGGSAITSYRIYRGTSSGSLALLATIGTNTSFVSAGLTNGQIYYYAVSAVNAAGEGTQSSEASATPRSTPTAPQSLSATRGNATVTLSWSAPSSNGGSAITNYKIYRGTSSGSLSLLATIGTNTSFISAGLTNGITYYYAVAATNAAGDGPQSTEASATPAGVPFPPTTFTATGGSGQVSLSWASGGTGGSAITNYQIHRGTTSGSLSLLTTIGTNTTYTDANVNGGTTYYYQIRAVNAIGTSNPSAERSATPAASGTPPTEPWNVQVSPANVQVGLSWSAPNSTGTSSITNYKIYRGTTSGSLSLLATIGTNTTYSDRQGLTNGVTYYYQISAVSAAGESARSRQVSAVPDSAVSVNCAGVTTTVGTVDSCGALQFADLSYAVLTEGNIKGSKTIEMQFTLNLTGVTGTHTLELNGYRGNAPEDLLVQAKNSVGTWVTIATLNSAMTTATTFSGPVDATNYWPTGTLTIRLIDFDPLDNNQSSWNIDYARLVTT